MACQEWRVHLWDSWWANRASSLGSNHTEGKQSLRPPPGLARPGFAAARSVKECGRRLHPERPQQGRDRNQRIWIVAQASVSCSGQLRHHRRPGTCKLDDCRSEVLELLNSVTPHSTVPRLARFV